MNLLRLSPGRIKEPEPPQNVAELLSDLGVVLRRRLHRGQSTKTATGSPDQLRWDSQLALQFLSLRPVVQLRAMVEDWPLCRIQEAVELDRMELGAETT
jgi:hypothetical protein